MKILNLLKKLISEFDPYGVEHGERVSVLAMRLAAVSGVRPDSQLMRDIQTAGLIHDCGKVGVPEAVRRQPGKFTQSEHAAMQGHVTYGIEMLALVTNGTINTNVVQIVKYHHKDFCGTGYPKDEIHGNNIPLGARVLRIVDSYDAMTHDRGYRHALLNAECLQELVDDQIKFTYYDPELLRLFLNMKKAG